MSRNNWGTWGQAIRMQQEARQMRAAQEDFAEIINRLSTRPNIHNLCPPSMYGDLPIDYNHDENLDSDYYDDYYGDDDDEEDLFHHVHRSLDRGHQNTFSGRSAQSPLLPHPRIKKLTSEEAEKHAQELLKEENRLKEKAEKKRQKKLRQRERKRLEKENANKDQLFQKEAVERGPSTSPPEKKENMNIPRLKETKENGVGPGPDSTQTDVTSREERHLSDEDEDEDEQREEETLSSEEEELDMNSSFISTAAAIAVKQLGSKNKLERKQLKNDNRPKMNKQEVQHNQSKRDRKLLEKEIADKDKSREELKEVEVDYVQSSLDLANAGNQFAAMEQFDVAAKYFTDAIKYNPRDYRLFGNRSFCYEKLQRFDRALFDADLALGMNPAWVKGLFRKGKALCGLQRYYEAALTYQELLQQDSSSVDASKELRKVQILQLMEMGFTHEQSEEALQAHGSFEAAVDALSGIKAGEPANGDSPKQTADEEEEWVVTQRVGHARKTPRASASAPASARRRSSRPAGATTPELFPVWVGSVVSTITEQMLHTLFSRAGEVFSIKMMPHVQCAFVNYTRKQDSETAIQLFHDFPVEGVILAVRHPNNRRPDLGVSRNAATDPNVRTSFPRRSASPLHVPNSRTIYRAK